MKTTDFSKHLSNFLSSYLPGLKNVSKNTISSYCDTFRLFLTYCRDERNMPIEKMRMVSLTAELVCDFLNWLEQERGCGIATRNQRLAAIHSFIRFVQTEAPENIMLCQKILEIPFRKRLEPTVKYLSTDEVKQILELPDTTTRSGRRDLALLCLLYDSGARVQELADLSVRHVRLAHPSTIQLTGKGNKSRLVPITANTAALLKNYLEEERLSSPEKADCPLFFNRQRKRLTRAGITYVLKKYSGVQNPALTSLTPHIFRHSKAMHLLQAGVNIVYIRDFLGHSDLKTTEIYARADPEARRAALESIAPVTPSEVPPWATDADLLMWLKSYGKVPT